MYHLGILGSTRGTGMLAIQDAIQSARLNASIEVVISNKSDALILERARLLEIETHFVSPTDISRALHEKKISDLLHAHSVDLILLIGYTRILTRDFITEWQDQILNVHPSLLPAFSGIMDEEVHRAVLAAGVKETGCTVHYVTEEVDAGRILIQKKCPVLPGDTVASLKSRVQAGEGDALIEAIGKHYESRKHPR